MLRNLILLATIQIAFATHSQKDQKFMNFVENHFSAGGGVHVLTIVPGPHAQIQVYPINFDRFKVYAELRGEMILAPLIGWNYNFQAATRILDNWGLHAGFGRSHYVGGMRRDSTESYNHFRFNSFEFGVTHLGFDRFVGDAFISIPMNLKNNGFPFFVLGVSAQFGSVWWNKQVIHSNDGKLQL
jgi:hypothetical protein